MGKTNKDNPLYWANNDKNGFFTSWGNYIANYGKFNVDKLDIDYYLIENDVEVITPRSPKW